MPETKRRLVICCDGTWNTKHNKDGTSPAPTNVRKFRASVAAHDAQGRPQEAFYREGVGTRGGALARWFGGAFGLGLRQDVQSALKWLAERYEDRDEIFLLGYSRGAYTARSLAGLIEAHGIPDLTGDRYSDHDKWGIVKYAEAKYRGRWKLRHFAHARDYAETSRPGGSVPIRFLGVWDTVGALGVPDDYAALGWLLADPGRHKFHNTHLGACVQAARHAVAIDEQRVDFVPTLWCEDPAARDVQELWFPGVHGDLGGAYADRGLGDVALGWMMEAAREAGLTFRATAFDDLRPDPRGTLHDSLVGVFAGRQTRPRAVPNMAPDRADPTKLSEAARIRARAPGIGEPDYWGTARVARGGRWTVTVPADKAWVPTQVFMEAGQVYRFEAAGEWMDASLRAGPDGVKRTWNPAVVLHALAAWPELCRRVYRKLTGNPYAEPLLLRTARRMPQAPWFGLVGVVANGEGADPTTKRRKPHQEVFVGKAGARLQVAGDGYFYAFANDAWRYYGNNRGRVTLTILREA